MRKRRLSEEIINMYINIRVIPVGQNGKEGGRFFSDKREWATNQNQQEKMKFNLNKRKKISLLIVQVIKPWN